MNNSFCFLLIIEIDSTRFSVFNAQQGLHDAIERLVLRWRGSGARGRRGHAALRQCAARARRAHQ